MKFSKTVLLLMQFCCHFHLISSLRKCHNAHQCSDHANITITNQTNIECYGDHSCFDAVSLSTTNAHIQCRGSFACANAASITLKTSDTSYWADLECTGLFSCAFTEKLFNFDDDTFCSGEKSCFGSVLGANGALYCRGDRSCANTQIRLDVDADTVQFSGYLSAQNALLYDDKYGVTYYFYGANSGDNAEVTCANGVSCTVYCYGGGCSNIKSLQCDGVCGIILYCDDAEKSDICENGYELASFIDHGLPTPEGYDNTGSTIENSQNICQDSSKTFKNCGDYWECSLDEDLESTNSNPGAICCSSYYGCYGADSIRTILDSSNDGVAIRCDGSYSCTESELIYAQNGGNVYLSGSYAAGTGWVTIETNVNYDIFCSGYYSCRYTTIESANNLYCTGAYSCYDCGLIQYVNTIWAYGRYSLYLSIVKNIYDSIYCGGYQSCLNVNIYNVNGDVYGHSYQVLHNAQIKQVNGSVYGIGTQALQYANIRNVKNVYTSH